MVNISNQVLINNLINVNDISSVVTMDFYYRTYWTDPRLSMPDFWNAITNKNIVSGGLDITQYLNKQNLNGNQAQIWQPDNFFPDAIHIDYGDEYIRLSPKGSLLWSRHITMDLLQSAFVYSEYPSDSHTIILRWISYGFTTSFMYQNFKTPGVILFANYENNPSFEMSPIWSYQGTTETLTVIGSTAGSYKSQGALLINISRYPQGVVTRLALPIFLLCTLGTLTFWSSYEGRSDSTVTILLAISALYIIIFQNIPMYVIISSHQ